MPWSPLALVAALVVATACARTITIGKDPEADPAVAKADVQRRYRVSMPGDHGIYAPMYLDMMKALDAGVGYEMMILPAPLYPATTEFRWMHTEDGATKADELCVATPSETPDPGWGAFKIQLSIEYAKTFWNSKAPIAETRLYKVFLHCVGHAVGYEDNKIDPTDVMNPDVQADADLAAFYGRFVALKQPVP